MEKGAGDKRINSSSNNHTFDCLDIIRTMREFVLGVNIGVSSWLSWIGETPKSSLKSISAVNSFPLLGLLVSSKSWLFGNGKTVIKLGAL